MIFKPSTVDNCRKLSIHVFRKKGRWKSTSGNITWSRGNVQYAWTFFTVQDNAIVLSWKGQQETITQTIPITTVQVNYGKRYFFQCSHCNRRAVILYLEQEFLCRKCCGLTYKSCQESHTRFHSLLGLTDSQFRNFMKVMEYARELKANNRAGKRMLQRLQRYIDKSGVIFS
jgi:hypothetical protein